MDSKSIIGFLAVCTLCLSISGLVASAALRNREESEVERIREFFQLQERRTQSQEAELSRKILRLDRVLRHIDSFVSDRSDDRGPESEEESSQDQKIEETSDDFYERLALALEEDQILQKPDPLEIARLTPEESDALRQQWRALPPLDDDHLMQGTIDELLTDPAWNPDGRQFSASERREIRQLMGRYKFFSKYAHSERTISLVLPLVPALRDIGAYIEYRLEDGLPEFDSSQFYSHQEIFDPEYARLYLFDNEEYPELRHHERVCYEQARVSFLDIYQFINVPPSDPAE